MKQPVYVVSYDPSWPDEFEKIRSSLGDEIIQLAIAIEHVGSTSVPGLAAKPIIDMDVVIPIGRFYKVKDLLEKQGYQHEGDKGILGREAFRYEDKPHLMQHHLYVVEQGNNELHRHIVFRNWLRTHCEYRDAYAAVKLKMAQIHRNDRDAYMQGKAAIIEEIYKKCGL